MPYRSDAARMLPALVPTMTSRSASGRPTRSCIAPRAPIIQAAPSVPPAPSTTPTLLRPFRRWFPTGPDTPSLPQLTPPAQSPSNTSVTCAAFVVHPAGAIRPRRRALGPLGQGPQRRESPVNGANGARGLIMDHLSPLDASFL